MDYDDERNARVKLIGYTPLILLSDFNVNGLSSPMIFPVRNI